MKTLLAILIVLLAAGFCFSQDCKIKGFELNIEKKSPIEKIVITELAVIGYGVFDYFAYNALKNGNIEYYRFAQGILFSAINLFLYKNVGFSSSVGFSLQVWGGVSDAAYYGMDKLYGHPGGFSNGNEFAINKYYSHLNFMPTVIGQEKVHGVDLLVNNALTVGLSCILQIPKIQF